MPTLDGGPRFRACLEALAAQRPALDALVVIDSGSVDGSAQAAAAAGATVLDLGGEAFDHGATRQRAAQSLPDVDVVVFLVQDAVPVGRDCLELLARGALGEGVGAATARQRAPADSPLLTQARVSRSPFAAAEPRRTGPFTPDELARLTPRQWRSALLLDDVACAVRGALFRRVGLRRADFGEDALLAYDLLWGGWSLLHVPEAVVEHGHSDPPAVAGQRYEQDARFFRERFGLRVRRGVLSALKGWLALLRSDLAWVRRHGSPGQGAWFVQAAALRAAMVAGQLRGSRGPLGQPPEVRAVPRPAQLLAAGADS